MAVEVTDGGGGDSAVGHNLFALTRCPQDLWLQKFMCGGEESQAAPEWREDIIRPFPLDASDKTIAVFAPIPADTVGYPEGIRDEGLLKWGATWRWEHRVTSLHREGVLGVPKLHCGEGTVIGSAWFELVREIKRKAADEGVQPASLWCIMGVEAMVESLRAGGLRPRVVFWMEGEKHV